MKDIKVIVLDLAKQVFQVHGVNTAGETVLRRTLKRGQVRRFFCAVTALPGGDRSVRWYALLGAGVNRAGS